MTYVNDDKRLQNMVEIYDYFAQNPGKGIAGLVVTLGICETAVRYRVNAAVQRGYLEKSGSDDYHGRGDKNIYHVTSKGRPESVPLAKYSHRGNPNPNTDSGMIRRKFTVAKQMGMPAYADLPLSFFGARQVTA